MTGVLFEQFLTVFNNEMKTLKKHAYLLMDNATSHKVDRLMSNTTVKFLPANTTAELQPKDAGIIQNMKMKYRKLVTKYFINCIEDGKPMTVDLRQAILMLTTSWNQVT